MTPTRRTGADGQPYWRLALMTRMPFLASFTMKRARPFVGVRVRSETPAPVSSTQAFRTGLPRIATRATIALPDPSLTVRGPATSL